MHCDLCDADLDEPGAVWVALNRFVVGNGRKCRMIEVQGSDGYIWDFDDDRVSGRALCWPGCAVMFVDGEHVEHAHSRRDET